MTDVLIGVEHSASCGCSLPTDTTGSCAALPSADDNGMLKACLGHVQMQCMLMLLGSTIALLDCKSDACAAGGGCEA